MRSLSSNCPTLCILPLLHGCGKITGPKVLLGLGFYDLDFLVFTKIEEKGGKV
jgi:hypothetical protein